MFWEDNPKWRGPCFLQLGNLQLHHSPWSPQNRRPYNVCLIPRGPDDDSLSEAGRGGAESSHRKAHQPLQKLKFHPHEQRAVWTCCTTAGHEASLHLLCFHQDKETQRQAREQSGKEASFPDPQLFSIPHDSIAIVAFSKRAKVANTTFCEITTEIITSMLTVQNKKKPKSQFFKQEWLKSFSILPVLSPTFFD